MQFLIRGEESADWGETSPMLWRHAKLPQPLAVFGGSISGIFLPSIMREFLGEGAHFPVACYFCHNGSRRNGEGTGIPFHDQAARNAKIWVPVSVDQGDIGAVWQGGKCPPHGEQAGLKDIKAVDFLNRSFADPDLGGFKNMIEKLLPFRAGDFLAVHNPNRNVAAIQYNRRGNNGTGKGAAPHLVNADDKTRFSIFKREVRHRRYGILHPF